jgi:hypothetical protein
MWVVTVMTDDLRRDKPWFYIVSPLSTYNAASSRKPITALRSALTVASRKDIDERLPALAKIYANLYLLESSKRGTTAAAEPGPSTHLLRSLLQANGKEVKLPGLYGGAHVYATVITSASSTSVVVTFEAGHETMEVHVGIGSDDTPAEAVKATVSKTFPRMAARLTIDLDVLNKEIAAWSASKLVRRIVEQVLHVRQDLVNAKIWPGDVTATTAAAEPRNECTSVSRVFPNITKLADTLYGAGIARPNKVYKRPGDDVEIVCSDIFGVTTAYITDITFRFETRAAGTSKHDVKNTAVTAACLVVSADPAGSYIDVKVFRLWNTTETLLNKTIKVRLASIESKLPFVTSREAAQHAAAKLADVIASYTLPLVQELAPELGASDD